MAELVKINGEELDEDVRDAGEKIPVQFVKSASPYTVGEVAGFNQRIVQNLVDRRVAFPLKEADVTKLRKAQQAKAKAHAAAAAERALDIKAASGIPQAATA